ncbi:MAG TPA: sugar kinase [Caulobacteraceae bacterium]|nr:sugar kinase [Caulobacteraceae bacterium]
MSPVRVVCFGEVLFRLSAPAGEVLLQSPRLDVCVGGAEANVAVSLARFGIDAAMASILPDNALGRAARDELRRHGVDTRAIAFASGRMGLYFLTPGAVLRPSVVTYDRSGSAFAEADPEAVDWEAQLDGADWLHLSGVTPAVGPQAAEAAVRAVSEARRLGVRVSFDGNFRGKMWSAWQGDAPAILRRIFEQADLAFADERDIALVLGRDLSRGDVGERRERAAEAAFAAFANLQRLAATVRTHRDVASQDLSALMFTRGGRCETRTFRLSGIVDRIGAGDAFAAGVLYSLIQGEGDQAALEFGLAAACLKHSILGDFNLVGEAEVRDLLAGGDLDVKR